MKKIVWNRGCVIYVLLSGISCYLVYTLWVGHNQRNEMKSIIDSAIVDFKKQQFTNRYEESVEKKQEALLVDDRSRSIWYEI